MDYILHQLDTAAGYTPLNNSLLRDDRLSPLAYRVVTYLLSMSKTWQPIPAAIAKALKLPLSAVRRAIRESIELGYAQRERLRDSQGKFAGCIIRIFGQIVDCRDSGLWTDEVSPDEESPPETVQLSVVSLGQREPESQESVAGSGRTTQEVIADAMRRYEEARLARLARLERSSVSEIADAKPTESLSQKAEMPKEEIVALVPLLATIDAVEESGADVECIQSAMKTVEFPPQPIYETQYKSTSWTDRRQIFDRAIAAYNNSKPASWGLCRNPNQAIYRKLNSIWLDLHNSGESDPDAALVRLVSQAMLWLDSSQWHCDKFQSKYLAWVIDSPNRLLDLAGRYESLPPDKQQQLKTAAMKRDPLSAARIWKNCHGKPYTDQKNGHLHAESDFWKLENRLIANGFKPETLSTVEWDWIKEIFPRWYEIVSTGSATDGNGYAEYYREA